MGTPPYEPRGTGKHHLAFYVDSMDVAVAYLKEGNVAVQGVPVTMKQGPSRRLTCDYFQAPWGMHLELVNYPQRYGRGE